MIAKNTVRITNKIKVYLSVLRLTFSTFGKFILLLPQAVYFFFIFNNTSPKILDTDVGKFGLTFDTFLFRAQIKNTLLQPLYLLVKFGTLGLATHERLFIASNQLIVRFELLF